jgi:hypothetical protein
VVQRKYLVIYFYDTVSRLLYKNPKRIRKLDRLGISKNLRYKNKIKFFNDANISLDMVIIVTLQTILSINIKALITVNIVCTPGTFKSESVNSTGLKNDRDLVGLSSTSNRGWATYDLSAIPSGVCILSVTANFTTYLSSGSGTNNIYEFLGNPADSANFGSFCNVSSQTLVNDLDIELSYVNPNNGTTSIYQPWMLTSEATNAKGNNSSDPFERVDIIPGQVPSTYSVYVVTVSHKGNLQAGSPQKFSLIITGVFPSGACPPDITIPSNAAFSTPLTESDTWIKTTSNTTTNSVVISPTATVKFDANPSSAPSNSGHVLLNPGFMANPTTGSFTAQAYNGCTAGSPLRLKQNSDTIVEKVLVDGSFEVVDSRSRTQSEFSLYPNPASTQLTITNAAIEDEKIQLIVLKLDGQVLINQEIEHFSTNYPLDVTQLSNGFYFIKIHYKGRSEILKFLKN